MGMDADLLVIAPFWLLAETDNLDYPKDFYGDITDPHHTLVISTVACADTTDQSKLLAELIGVDPWDFSQHIIKGRALPPSNIIKPNLNERIGSDTVMDVVKRLIVLSSTIKDGEFVPLSEDVTFIYRPGG